MVSFSKSLTSAFSFLALASAASVGEPNSAYVCSFCVIVSGLAEQAAVQLQLEPYLETQCGDSVACKAAVKVFTNKLLTGIAPDTICAETGLCNGECKLYSQWPLLHVPDAQPEWPTERRLEEGEEVDLKILAPIFRKLVGESHVQDPDMPFFGHMVHALAALTGKVKDDDCTHNVTCKILAFADNHVPLQDHDQDRFSSEFMPYLRGTHWRGTDCNDKSKDVYPGQKNSIFDASVDHNCNGIFGGNATGSYEDLFCSGTEQRGLIMIGDSATAHFHIPPQWITANGWNLDQFLQVAMDELDFPMCSWGTGHVTPEECPIQTPVPGVTGVTSLYTQLRQRNRCNHNDFQNIGVNGARTSSSLKLVNSMARHQTNDHPALVWFSMIGNDVCNGHPGFDHMTPPDEFYTNVVNSLNAIDAIVPKGSHVVALALFDGELLYDIMHEHQHPVGSRYSDIYDFMNCLEENPCWGWLNSNQTVRQMTTQWSNSLNREYTKIANTMKFNNFDFIFYSPNWVKLFQDYQDAGYSLVDLIEKADGFHPSQAGNALFATQFFAWLEAEHPEALGPVNPHNDEIDALFWNNQNKKTTEGKQF